MGKMDIVWEIMKAHDLYRKLLCGHDMNPIKSTVMTMTCLR
jgi:hypothetical protein